MPRTNEPTRTVEKEERPRRRARDAREADVGLGSRETEKRSEGVGYAEERETRETEHRSGREDTGGDRGE